MSHPTLACDMSALSPPERERYNALRRKMMSAIRHVRSTAFAFHVLLDSSIPTVEAAEWMAFEQRCCPFLTLRLTLEPENTRWMEMGGSETIKAFVADEFGGFTPR
jgi:hypothetical protein